MIRKSCNFVSELSPKERRFQLVEMRVMADEMTCTKAWRGQAGIKHIQRTRQSGHIRAGEALYRDFEVRNLYILQQAAGELKNFP